jgi:O-acetylserine/cysteine efflux transporter
MRMQAPREKHHHTPRKWLLYLLLVLAPASWGAVFIVLREMNAVREQFGISAWEIVYLRFIPSALLFLPMLISRRAELRVILREDFWTLLWIGLLTTSVYNVFLITGEERVPASMASLFIAVGPSATFVLSMFFLGERATIAKIAGIAISTLGLVFITRGGVEGESRPGLFYVLLTLTAPLSWSVATVMGKRLLHRHDPLLLTAASVVLGSLPLLVVPLFANASLRHAGQIPVGFWLNAAYLVLFPTVFGYCVWYKALAVLEASRVSAFVFLVPVFGVLFASFREEVGTNLLLGGVVVLAGVIITAYGLPRGSRSPPGKSDM